MILIIDNYDSFTYNLVQTIGGLNGGYEMKVVRNDQASVDELAGWGASHLIVSPGPGTPDDAGVSCALIKRLAGQIPMLGVCLGYQCIGQVFGGRVGRASRLMHGKTSEIRHVGTGIYEGVANPFTAARYHSLNIEAGCVPEVLEPTAWTEQDELMGVRHREMPIEGVQFHPESFLTAEGAKLLANFLRAAKPTA
jgi:anthranilate synthase/aminodeoxychorismate synthase-like glutamine amidotransferase